MCLAIPALILILEILQHAVDASLIGSDEVNCVMVESLSHFLQSLHEDYALSD